jgi:pyruvate/2-oxoglutarate dehydrogenase complex dihydrolipoamide acyltransferase (E2) component
MARQRTLLRKEIRGGSFTISNFGSFSGPYGNPTILPPKVGILVIGRLHQEPVVKDGAVVPELRGHNLGDSYFPLEPI